MFPFSLFRSRRQQNNKQSSSYKNNGLTQNVKIEDNVNAEILKQTFKNSENIEKNSFEIGELRKTINTLIINQNKLTISQTKLTNKIENLTIGVNSLINTTQNILLIIKDK